ncbi:uncharacterized protein sS8_3904 [Methylocaldum marinum]|uniref:HEAT repeat domain-containing protein n=1 Tax=Methylocaldum marinum TaxID=1432792 RepID=A0A250KWD2_9GAMM|nr:DUF6493 family protein [Methylocaldum marinum]BBA35836.1 uncharacterized protein sS8_3904 [Methylocaldum marinum]
MNKSAADATLASIAKRVRRLDSNGIAEALAPLDEAERRTLGPGVYRLYQGLARGEGIVTGSQGMLDKALTPLRPRPSSQTSFQQLCTAAIAVLGCCTLGEAGRIRFYDHWRHAEAIVRVLKDRKPKWANAWLDHCLAARDVPLLGWDIVRTLVREGVCAPPESPGYVGLMAQSLGRWRGPRDARYVPISVQLRANPDLLESAVWRLFEVDTPAFAFDWRAKDKDRPDTFETWPQALLNLARDGLLARERLLDASLDALWLNENGTVLGNLCRFHADLAPSPSEMAERWEKYADLLRHRSGHVVGVALARLPVLLEAEASSYAVLVPRLAAVFDARAKGAPLSALKILKRGLELDESLADAALPVLSAALLHPAAEVQSTALTLLSRCAPGREEEVASVLATSWEELSPSVRARTGVLFPGFPGAREADHASGADAPPALPEDGRESAGAMGWGGDLQELPPPLPFSILDVSQLATATPVALIDDLETLIQQAAHLVETADDGLAVERLMDGISRLCDQRPADFEARTAALARRIGKAGNSEVTHGIIGWLAPSGLLNLLHAWLHRSRRVNVIPGWGRYRGPVRLFQDRLNELSGRVARGLAAPLLSAPTHAGGWIAAPVLVQRLRELQERKLPIPTFDFQQALFRLAPDQRITALEQASMLDGEAGRVLRFALGSEQGPTKRDRRAAPLWVAAARARWPDVDLSLPLAPLKLPRDWPDLVTPARYTWRSESRTRKVWRETRCHPHIALEVTPRYPRHVRPREHSWDDYLRGFGRGRKLLDQILALPRIAFRVAQAVRDAARCGQSSGAYAFPTVVAHEPVQRGWWLYGYHANWVIEILGWSMPLATDAFFAGAVPLLIARLDMDGSSSEPNAPFLLPLIMGGRPWSEMGMLVLCLGLVAKDAALRGMAVDVLITGIEDGRAGPESLASVLARIAEGQWLKRNRLAKALAEVSRVSALHALTAARLIEQMLCACGSVSTDDLPLLELLHELLIDLAGPVHEKLCVLLESVAGNKSKTARIARQLCDIPPGEASERYREALRAAVAARTRRDGASVSVDVRLTHPTKIDS